MDRIIPYSVALCAAKKPASTMGNFANHMLYIDFETFMSSTCTLKKLTLRDYLSQTHCLGFSYALDDGEINYVCGNPGVSTLADLQSICESDDWCVVAHNAAFDVRVMRHLLGLPQPRHVRCTLELACAALPNNAGGYSLANLARTLGLGDKLDINLSHHTPEQLEKYCKRDTELCRKLYNLVAPVLCDEELEMAELANAARELWLEVDQEKVVEAFKSFDNLASVSAVQAYALLGDGGEKAFGLDGDTAPESIEELSQQIENGEVHIRSVKPHAVKQLLLENLGFDAQSISRKKINPEKLRANPTVAGIISSVERANKSLSHRRRVNTFVDRDLVDLEFGYARATTTLRFSSPQPGGKGINLHNMAKRDKVISKALRSIFRFPDGHCAVRADFANVEYRIMGKICGCEHTEKLFSVDPLADPYLGFGNKATGRTWEKKDPVRNGLFKPAVLGLSYMMSHYRFTEELLKAFADPECRMKSDDLRRVCADMRWDYKSLPAFAKSAVTRLKCPEEFATVAWFMREGFHEVHPEFGRTARWLLDAVARLNRAIDPELALEQEYEKPNAPPRNYLSLEWLADMYGSGTKSVGVRLFGWPQPTVVWRDIGMREALVFGKPGITLTAMHAKKGYRPLTLNIVIENCGQGGGRNGLVYGHLELAKKFPYQFSVHDELMLVVPKTPKDILAARSALCDLFAPGAVRDPFGWSVVIDPEEISVTQSMYEGLPSGVPSMKEFWIHMEANAPDVLSTLS